VPGTVCHAIPLKSPCSDYLVKPACRYYSILQEVRCPAQLGRRHTRTRFWACHSQSHTVPFLLGHGGQAREPRTAAHREDVCLVVLGRRLTCSLSLYFRTSCRERKCRKWLALPVVEHSLNCSLRPRVPSFADPHTGHAGGRVQSSWMDTLLCDSFCWEVSDCTAGPGQPRAQGTQGRQVIRVLEF
jgi:hypothetical protein